MTTIFERTNRDAHPPASRTRSLTKRTLSFVAIACLAALGHQVHAAPLKSHSDLGEQADVESVGLWTTYRLGERLYFELPSSVIDVELLAIKRRFKGEEAYGDVGKVGRQLIRWERRADRIVLNVRQARLLADSHGAPLDDRYLPWEWEAAGAFPVLFEGRNRAPVIDVTPLFTSAIGQWFDGETATDGIASRIDRARSFPKNVVVATRADVARGSESVFQLTHWNFVRLPERPMMSRQWDRRSPQMFPGFWSGSPEPAPNQPEVMLRWRLEKKHPERAISDPVVPIVIYVDRATPPKWRPYMRRAIEAWQPAFEAAGFSNAIIARDAPDDPEWSLEDVRHSVLLWSTREPRIGRALAQARGIFDPRTGEYLQVNEGSRAGYPDHENSYVNFSARYFFRAATVDPRARKWPFDDELRGEIMQMIASHEVGHMLGLRDGSFGKYVYSVESVRSPEWVRRMGFTPSLMNYSRFNYVAQPEDGMPAELLFQRVGPADKFWIRMAYAPVPGATSAIDERAQLEHWLAEIDRDPVYRFSLDYSNSGPDTPMDVIETTDPITGTQLGVKNLVRAIEMIPEAVTRGGAARGDVQLLADNAIMQWRDMMSHVVSLVGGYTRQRRAGHELRAEATPVPAREQRRAMAYLAEAAFQPPLYLRAPSLVRLLPVESRYPLPPTEIDTIVTTQKHVLDQLIGEQALRRMQHLAEAEVGAGIFADEADRYTLSDMLRDLRHGLWSELRTREVSIDVYRQGLQELYIEALRSLLMGQFDAPAVAHPLENLMQKKPIDAFIRNAVVVELRALRDELATAKARAQSPVVKAHLSRMHQLIGMP